MDSEQVVIEASGFINSQIIFGAEYYNDDANAACDCTMCMGLN